MMHHQLGKFSNNTFATHQGPSTPSPTIAYNQPNQDDKWTPWTPGSNEQFDLHMGIAIWQLCFYGVVLFITAFFFVVRNRCRIFANGWWINLLSVCICRVSSSIIMISEIMLLKENQQIDWDMYGASIQNDLVCLVALYLVHLSFVERLCQVVGKRILVAVCFWLMLSHFIADPFIIAATWGAVVNGRQMRESTIQESTRAPGHVLNIVRDLEWLDVFPTLPTPVPTALVSPSSASSSVFANPTTLMTSPTVPMSTGFSTISALPSTVASPSVVPTLSALNDTVLPDQINAQLLLVGIAIGLYLFLVQSVFAIVAVKKRRGISSSWWFFELGVLAMIPFILTRQFSVLPIFWNFFEFGAPHGPRYYTSMARVYIETIPENIMVVLALILAFFAPKYNPEMLEAEKQRLECPQVDFESQPQPGAPGMAFTPLKVNSTNILMAWYNAHIKYPFPTEEEKLELIVRTGFTADMIDIWFEDTRDCTNTQQVHSEIENRISDPIPSTDGSYDIREVRSVLTRNFSVPPPVMLGPRRIGNRIITPPSGPLIMRMTMPGTAGLHPVGKISSWSVAPEFMKATMGVLSMRTSKMYAPSGEHCVDLTRDINAKDSSKKKKTTTEDQAIKSRSCVQPMRPNCGAIISSRNHADHAAQTFQSSKLDSGRCKPVQVEAGRIATPEEWELAFGVQMNATRIGRIQELTHESSEDTKKAESVNMVD